MKCYYCGKSAGAAAESEGDGPADEENRRVPEPGAAGSDNVTGGLSVYNDNKANNLAAETTRLEAAFEVSTGETEEETEAQPETQTETATAAQTAAYDPEEASQETKAAANLRTGEEKKEENRMSCDYTCIKERYGRNREM